MLNNYTLAWSFRNRVTEIQKSMITASNTCPDDVDFVLVDAASSPETLKQVKQCAEGLPRTVRICESAYRSSLSQAWNLAMMLTPNRYMIFASSDVVFKTSGWFNALAEGLKTSPYVLLQNHGVFGIDKAIIPKIGWFDEQFGPGAHFDCDYMIRASEAGIPVKNLPNDGYYVHDEENIQYTERVKDLDPDRLPIGNFANERYFMEKWKSGWKGWERLKGTGVDLPHPPTHIKVCERRIPEVDPHPIYTKQYAGELC